MPGFYEPEPGQVSDPSAIVTGCIESGSRAVLFDGDSTPAGFFDLSTRVAGEILHGLAKYGIRLAVVVPDLGEHSSSFQDFAREANRGEDYRFFPRRAAAVEWLDGR